jgi:acyl transferase domain-containing protein/thioesterase domain-containing protein/NAD(P)-dependent dehydrogenase (short-subunit alcohol dehydrogenase family)
MSMDGRAEPEAVAIIGMACRFPGAASVEAFWENLKSGVESIRTLSDEELLAAGVSPDLLSDPSYVKACPVLDDIDKFDAAFFGMSPRDASVMDPAQRLFLEIAWQALEHAGYSPEGSAAPIGVFAASGAPLYLIENVRTNAELMRSMGEFLVRHTGNDMNFLATRVSYELDLRGPSLNVQTACSSALVAVHLACQSLLRGECGLALAGASTVLVPMGQGYTPREGEILSPDGHCRPFDASSAGTVFGSGTGCVVLKRLSDALDDGDTIHAVIKGSAINNDGSLKVGYLAPSVDGQAEVIATALTAAGVSARDISYVEAHGTGTLVGDPIELEGLRQAYARHTDAKQFCALSSVKGNIGHLGEAAGIAALIKAVLALTHRTLPPTLHYTAPNPQFDFEASPFFVQATTAAWQAQGPLRCGVTALGAGGTNCHVILEQPPEAIPGEGERAQQLLVLSAKTRDALERATELLASHLERSEQSLADIAYTLGLGRKVMPQRRVLVAETRAEAAALLRARDTKRVLTHSADERAPSVVFMFPGGGAQYSGMGAELYASEAAYRDAVDACFALLPTSQSSELRGLVFAAEADRARATAALTRPTLTLPALFITEYALAKLFLSWGVTPAALLGHSMGEYVAACIAQVITLEEALSLVLLRGRLFERTETGGMLSVALPDRELNALLPSGLSVAAYNAPGLSVVSGARAQIDAFAALLGERGVENTRVHIDVAAHSALLDPILDEFRALCRSIQWRAPRIPIVSNLTGRMLRAEEACDPEYWVQHLRQPVRFAQCLASLRAQGAYVLLELGPGRTLSSLVRAQEAPAQPAFSVMRHPQEAGNDLQLALAALGKLWLHGARLDAAALYDGQLRNRVPLPTYPFERTSYWVAPGAAALAPTADGLRKHERLDDWFSVPTWLQRPLVIHGQEGSLNGAEARDARWLVFSDGSGTVERLLRRLGTRAVHVTPGPSLRQLDAQAWEFDPGSSNQHQELLDALGEQGFCPTHVVYALGLSLRARGERTLHRGTPREAALVDSALVASFFAPTFLARALGRLGEPVSLSVLTSGVAQVDQAELTPLHALVLGPALVAPREFPQLKTRVIDVPHTLWRARVRDIDDALLRELTSDADDRLVALRPRTRWVRSLTPLPLPACGQPGAWFSAGGLREGGVYVLSGGLGGIALEVAQSFARHRRVKLALLSRSALPPEAEWDALLTRLSEASPGARRIRKLREIRALGAEVEVFACDVAERDSLLGALDAVRARFGAITGVVHAAGLLDDEPMLARTVSSMRRVLSPKLHGTLNLDALIHEPLDFFVLFSSISSQLGLPGQVDYTAANAFLDAFAHERAARAPGRTLVVNWSAWREVGMAALSLEVQRHGRVPSTPCAHPALDGYADERGVGRVFSTDFSVDSHWLLAEHQIEGASALLSGTSFVELTRAAFSVGRTPGPIEITDLSFLTPFQVGPKETRRLSIQLTPAGGALEVTMRTAGSDPRTPPHVVGDVREYTGPRPERLALRAIARRCRTEQRSKDRFLEQHFVRFGPRWANLVRSQYGEGEALLELALDPSFHADLAHYQLHPALLDMATGGAQRLIRGFDAERDFYVPVAYGSLRMFAPLPAHLFSHVRLRPESQDGEVSFDVTLTDADGEPCVQIERFAMRRLAPGSQLLAPQRTQSAESPEQARGSAELTRVLRQAIAPEEGVRALERVLSQPTLVQCLISSVDVESWERSLSTSAVSALSEVEHAPLGFARPTLSSDYVAPASPSEELLARVWSELLGVRQIGVLDDFFELGGNSLLAVRLFAAVKRQYGVSLPLSTLFEAPSIRPLAQLLDANVERSGKVHDAQPEAAARTQQGYSSLVPMQVHGERPPFYCAAGMGGNPLNLRALAQYVGSDQPFYGLQPQGLDGSSPLHATIPEMASYYIGQILKAQPKGPYYLGGYSGGGVVAFEMAKQLQEAGHAVGALVFLDSLAPVMPLRSVWERLDMHAERLRTRGTRYVLDTLSSRMETELRHATARLRRPIARLFPYHFRLENIADTWIEAASVYRPTPYAGDAMLYRAGAPSGLTAGTAIKLDAHNGWSGYVLGGIEVNECPGDHNTMCEEPHVRVLARRLRAYLDRRMAVPSAGASAARLSELGGRVASSSANVPREDDVRAASR